MELDVNLNKSEVETQWHWEEMKSAVEKLDCAPKCFIRYLQDWQDGIGLVEDYIGFQMVRHDGKRTKAFEPTQEQFKDITEQELVEILKQYAETIYSKNDDSFHNRQDKYRK